MITDATTTRDVEFDFPTELDGTAVLTRALSKAADSANDNQRQGNIGTDEAANDNGEPPSPGAPAASLPGRAEFKLDEWPAYQQLHRFVRDDLPEINNAISQGASAIDELISRVRQVLDCGAIREAASTGLLSKDDARWIIQLLDFPLSSTERHAQQAGLGPGCGIQQYSGIEQALLQLAEIGAHPPRGSYLTYWLLNDGERPLTFTGNTQEVYFNKAVNITARNLAGAAALMKTLQSGTVPVDIEFARDVCERASALVMSLVDIYQGYRRTNPETRLRNLEPSFFMEEMRQYLLRYPVGGKMIDGPNATYSPQWAQFDAALGYRDLRYLRQICGRYEWIMPEDWKALSDSLALPPVPDVLLAMLGHTWPSFLGRSDEEIVLSVDSAGASAKLLFAAYGQVAQAHAKLSAVHWSLIKNYLVKPSATLQAERLKALPVAPIGGVSSTPLAQTEQNDVDRRANPVNLKLIQCFVKRTTGTRD
jgi:hypothetical protein